MTSAMYGYLILLLLVIGAIINVPIALSQTTGDITFTKQDEEGVQTFEEFESASIKCTVRATPAPTIEWYQDGIRIYSGGKYHIDPDVGLTISNITRDDEDLYTCKAVIRSLSQSKSMDIFVDVQVPPTWLFQPSDETRHFGSSVEFHCLADGDPSPDYTWTFKNNTINYDGVKYTSRNGGEYLSINDLTKDDDGTYVCEASNAAGTISGAGELTVLKPRCGSDQVNETVTVGQTVTLFCTVLQGQDCTLKWFHEGREMVLGQQPTNARIFIQESIEDTQLTLTITGVQRSDDGGYTCQLENEVNIFRATHFVLVKYEFLSCTRGDRNPRVRCPTTQRCISKFAMCDYVDDCGNGEDEAGCVDNDVCSEKRVFVEQILNSCPLRSRTVLALPGESGGQFVSWNITGQSSSQTVSEQITQVTFDFFHYGTGLYRINFTSMENVVIFRSEGHETSPVQTKALPSPLLFTSYEMVTLEQYIDREFVQQSVTDSLNITVVSGDCEAASQECLIAVQRANRVFDCTSNLGDMVYTDFYNVEACPSFCEMEVLTDTLVGTLTFARVNIGQKAMSEELCSVYSSMAGEPRASRTCSGDFGEPSRWEEPVINNCFEGETDDLGLNNLTGYVDNNPVTEDNVTEVSRDLADATEMTDLNSEDLVSVAELLEIVTGVQSPSPEVTSNVIETIDNVLDLKENTYVESIPSEEVPARILRSLETQLKNLHDGRNVVNFTDIRSFVGAIARSFDRDEFSSDITFGNFFSNNARNIAGNLNESDTKVLIGAANSLEDIVKAAITLPSSVVRDIQTRSNGTIPVTFVIHRTSHLFMSNSTLKEARDEGLETLIISATIEGQKIDNLVDPVVSKYYPKSGADKQSRKCVFWDVSRADGYGAWSERGCSLVSNPDESGKPLLECHCNHLTNFAVLVDIQGDIENVILDILSIIGCLVSIIALLITIVTFLAVKKLREKRPQQILVNLCFALLGLYLCFLIGIGRSNLPVGCVIFGALIHYFCLAAVAWMCVEATNMYLLFVRVFDAGISGFMRKACVAAWGLPLIVVVVSAVLKSKDYTSSYCFPQAETLTLYIGVLLVIALMLCYNLVIFTLVIRQLTCGRKTMGQNQDKRKEMYRRAQNAIAISVLLGLTWAFGYMSIGGAQFIFNLLFLIFNSLQGLFIFIFFCVRQDEIRSIWWRWLTCRGGKDDKYLDVKYKVVSSQGSQPSKDSSNLVKSNKGTDSTNVNSESIQMIDSKG